MHIPSKEIRNPPRAVVEPSSNDGLDSQDVATLGARVEVEDSESQTTGDESSPAHSDSLTTHTDHFGVYRVYARKPLRVPLQSSDPPDLYPLCDDLSSSHSQVPNQGPLRSSTQPVPYYLPFSNPSAAAMMVIHHLGGPTQSRQQSTHISSILGDLYSDLSDLDLRNFNTTTETRRLDAYIAGASESAFQHEDGWTESSVRIRLPLDKKKMLEADAAEFDIGGVFHRDIMNVISSVYQSDIVKSFEHVPFKEFWKASEDAPPERLYGEIFSSQAMLDADDEVCKCCLENDSDSQDLEAVSVPLMLYSDSTHLANFGNASAWPVYMFFGSQSKYVRAMPTSSACHHIAYLPSVHNIEYLYFII